MSSSLNQDEQLEQSFRLTIDRIPGLVNVLTASGEMEFCNQQLLDYFGKTVERLKDWATSDIVHPDDLSRVTAAWTHSVTTGEALDIQHRLRRADGVYRWFHGRALPLRDAQGRVVRWYSLLIDIDDRRHAEEKLRRTEAFLLEAQRLSHTGGWKHDLATGRVTTWPETSSEMLRVYGAEADEDTSAPEFWFNRIHPEDRQRVLDTFTRCEIEKTDYRTDYRIVLPDGTVKYQHSVGHPVLNESGELVEFVGTAMDTTEQWHARVELEETNLALVERERDLRLLVDSIPGMVYTMNAVGDVQLVNEQLLTFLATTAEALKEWISFIHPDDHPRVLALWQSTIRSGQPYDVEHRLRRGDGVYRWFNSRGVPVRDADGRVVRWYSLLTDVDDRKSAEEALRQTQSHLARAAQIATVAELSASIAHEVNQPLAAVVANGHACLRWLSAEPPNLAKAAEAVDRIVRDGKDAGEVVRRVRALFKRAAVEKIALNVNDVINEVLRLLEAETTRKRVTVEVDLDIDLPPVVGDRIQLQQLVLNLLLNGLEAMDSVRDRPKNLIVRSKRSGRDVALIEIRDYGLGLTDPVKAFEAFFTTKQGGMGMGLAICRSIVDAHDGQLWASSDDAPGTTFSFTLPLGPTAQPEGL